MLNDLTRNGFVLMALGLSSFLGCAGEKREEKDPKQNAETAENKLPISERIIGNWRGTPQIEDAAFEAYAKKLSVPEDQRENVKKMMTEERHLLSFEKSGAGKLGYNSMGRVGYVDIKWKVESETGNKAVIAIDISDTEEDVKLDVTFQDDGSMVAKPIRPEEAKGNMPDVTIHFKKVDKLPEATQEPPTGKTIPTESKEQPPNFP